MSVTPDRLVYDRPNFLFAIGDSRRLDVNRSPLVTDDDIWLVPIKLFVREHGLVKLSAFNWEQPKLMFGEGTFESYVHPEDRRDGIERERIELDDFAPIEVHAIRQWTAAVLSAAQRQLDEQQD